MLLSSALLSNEIQKMRILQLKRERCKSLQIGPSCILLSAHRLSESLKIVDVLVKV